MKPWFIIIFFIYNFFAITPYHYTYLNALNGETKYRYTKFENDYWTSSINELFKISSFPKNKNLKFSTCGVSNKTVETYLNKKGYFNIDLVNPKDSEFIVMTNRAILDYGINNEISVTNCFVKFVGKDIFKVERNGLPLSLIRKIN